MGTDHGTVGFRNLIVLFELVLVSVWALWSFRFPSIAASEPMRQFDHIMTWHVRVTLLSAAFFIVMFALFVRVAVAG